MDLPPLTDNDAVLAANLRFYAAFTNLDAVAMDAVWASAIEVTCTHPGWRTLEGRDAVMASWRRILGSPNAPRVACHNERALVIGTMGYVTCEEHLQDATLAATNIFMRQGDEWRMLHHQATQIVERR